MKKYLIFTTFIAIVSMTYADSNDIDTTNSADYLEPNATELDNPLDSPQTTVEAEAEEDDVPAFVSRDTGNTLVSYMSAFVKRLKITLCVYTVALGLAIWGLFYWVVVIADRQKELQQEVNAQRMWIEDLYSQSSSKLQAEGFAGEGAWRPGGSGSGITNGIPRVNIRKGVIQHLADYINAFRQQQKGVETGCALVGSVVGSGAARAIEIKGSIDAGPKSEQSFGHVQFDRHYQQDQIKKMQLIDPDTGHIGDCHLHPGAMDRCSSGDRKTDQQNVKASVSQEMVFIIVTSLAAHPKEPDERCVCHDGLKFDVFYMGKSSDYEYVKIVPNVIAGNALSVVPRMDKYYKSDPTRVTLDFENLQRLARFDFQVVHNRENGPEQAGECCVQLAHKKLNYKILICIGDSTSEVPEVYIEAGNKYTTYCPDFLNATPPEHIWLTDLALSAARGLEEKFRKRKKTLPATKVLECEPRPAVVA